MATISGIFNDPFGNALAGVTITLTARTTTEETLSGTTASVTTDTDGSYSMSVLTGCFAVSATIGKQVDYLGVIEVNSDSVDGTLNEFLSQ